jgi:hypothetical protein
MSFNARYLDRDHTARSQLSTISSQLFPATTSRRIDTGVPATLLDILTEHAALLGLFIHLPLLHLGIAVVAAVIFTDFLVYDFNRLANRAMALAGAVIMLAVAPYLDIFNLFLNLLTILRQGCAAPWARSGPPGARHRHRLGHRRADPGAGPVLLHERGGRHPAGGAGAYDHHVDLLGSGSHDDHLLGRHAMRHRGEGMLSGPTSQGKRTKWPWRTIRTVGAAARRPAGLTGDTRRASDACRRLPVQRVRHRDEVARWPHHRRSYLRDPARGAAGAAGATLFCAAASMRPSNAAISGAVRSVSSGLP